MAYRIGQFRRSQLDSYYNNHSPSNIGGMSFTTCATGIYTNKSGVMNPLEKGKCYYLKFTTSLSYLGNTNFRNITLKLSQANNSENNVQVLNLQNNLSIGTREVTLETIFVPNYEYSNILFQINRIPEDNNITNNVNTKGAVFNNINVNSFFKLPNTIDILKVINPTFYQDMKYFKKIGIQAPTGFQFNIEGQNIRIGNSGIYQVNNGYKIKEIYFWPIQNSYFIMDFEY